jgi:hypothetical protein
MFVRYVCTHTAFVLQQDPAGLDAVGSSGANLGYGGLRNRYACAHGNTVSLHRSVTSVHVREPSCIEVCCAQYFMQQSSVWSDGPPA